MEGPTVEHQRNPAAIIDVQTHYVAPEPAGMLRAFRTGGGVVHGLPARFKPGDPMTRLDALLEAMDAAQIRVSVLSFAPVGILSDPAFAADLCRAANDGLLAACAAHPDRFVMAAALPMPDGQASLSELRRIAGEDALRAVHLVAQTSCYRPDAPEYEQLFACAAAAGLPVIIHPAAGIADLSAHFDAHGLSSGMHAMVSNALVAARIIQSGMMDRIEGLELIVTHLGGILPFLIDRLDSRAAGPASFPPSHYLRRRVWVDACGYPPGPALRCAIETMGTDRVMIGSDWPSRPIAPALAAIRELGLATPAERAILGGNAARWFDPARRRSAQ